MFKYFSFLVSVIFLAGCAVPKLPVTSDGASNSSAYVEDARTKTFANFHGVQMSPQRIELEGEGMSMFIEKVDMPPSKKSLNRVKNAYMPNGDIYQMDKITLPEPNLILLGGEAISSQYSTTSLLFIVPSPDSALYAIQVESAFMLDFDKAGMLVADILENGLPDYVITTSDASVVDFAGRKLELGDVCQWEAPHHLECTGLGELQWSLYKSAEDARLAMQIEMAVSEARSGKLLEKNENVNLTFEGHPTTATKVVYHLKDADGEDDKKIAYYMAATIRGNHVFCKATFRAGEARDEKLSPLAARVISF